MQKVKAILKRIWWCVEMPPAMFFLGIEIMCIPGARGVMWRLLTKKESRKHFWQGYKGS